MQTTEVGLSGGALAIVEHAGEGPALVMLHAGVSERHMWDRQWEWLQHSMRVIRWDMRGFGETAGVAGPFSYVDDVIRVMDVLDVPQAIIMGASMGGSTALQLAIRRPERVAGLVLVGPGVPGYRFDNPPEVDDLFERTEAAFAKEDIDEALALTEQIWLVGPGRRASEVDPQYLARARQLLRQSDQPDSGAESLDAPWSAEGRLGEIKVPVLAIGGTADVPDILAGMSMLAETLPKARLAMIEDAAHLPNMEKPRQFDAVLSDWLGEVVPQPDPEP